MNRQCRRGACRPVAALVGPGLRRRDCRFEELGIVVREPPALNAAEQRCEVTHIRAGAGAEIDDLERLVAAAARVRGELGHQRRRACRRVERLPQREPLRGEAAHPLAPRPSSAAANLVAAVAQVGNDARAARALAPSAARRAGSSSTELNAFASARLSPGATRIEAFAGTVSGIAPAVVLTTGSPNATASASAMP